MSISAYNENIIYTSISSNDKKELLGVYKTTNGGGAWSTINPGEDIFGGQGWYDNVISVCPTDPDIVLLGGVTFWRSSDGGSNWSKIETPDLHADNHRIRWSEDGNNVWVASDGGLAFSNDKGITWKTDNNWFPITQYVNFDVDREGKNICGGSQYPNPFNPSTTIKYSIPKQSNVTLKVFDVLGSEVATLVNKEQPQGNYEVEFDGSELTSGIYFYRLQAGDFVETKKMILIK